MLYDLGSRKALACVLRAGSCQKHVQLSGGNDTWDDEGFSRRQRQSAGGTGPTAAVTRGRRRLQRLETPAAPAHQQRSGSRTGCGTWSHC